MIGEQAPEDLPSNEAGGAGKTDNPFRTFSEWESEADL
jgi:hypothetical protein